MSEHQKTTQAVVATQSGINENQRVEKFVLFNSNGTPHTGRNQAFAPCVTATAIGTAAKTVDDAEPAANTLVPIKFTNGNSAGSPTVAFAGGSARTVYLAGAAPSSGEVAIAANGVALFWFDGTILHQIGVYS